MIQALGLEPEAAVAALAENLDRSQIDKSNLVVSAVAEGRCYIGVTLEETALKAVAAGYDIGIIYPEEGTSALPDGAAIIKGCRHEENARRFIDFLLSEELQQRLPQSFCRRSVLSGAERSEDEGLRLIKYDIEWAGEVRAALLKKWSECFEGGAV